MEPLKSESQGIAGNQKSIRGFTIAPMIYT
jgi:hypothetical protein